MLQLRVLLNAWLVSPKSRWVCEVHFPGFPMTPDPSLRPRLCYPHCIHTLTGDLPATVTGPVAEGRHHLRLGFQHVEQRGAGELGVGWALGVPLWR